MQLPLRKSDWTPDRGNTFRNKSFLFELRGEEELYIFAIVRFGSRLLASQIDCILMSERFGAQLHLRLIKFTNQEYYII